MTVLNPSPLSMSKELLEKSLIAAERKAKEDEIWNALETRDDLSLNEKLQAYEAELQRQANLERIAEEDKRQQLMSYITKNSKTKAYTLKGLSMEELTRRAQLVADKLATSKDGKAKRAQMIEELVANRYGSKASVSKWKEERMVDTYRK
jgi:hypothetical protein